uniref:Uncharacterized protein n=2 Tax=Ralstonia TaxID=48736 RepID=A0A0S4UPH1_RALSL|nr:conserved protein of unknown function [Ralstonia solanacearum]CUV37661.1 conserved protein of unknown function [Ralstonia solanacearum]CUV38860.1 conserved protein of unknown function [Ralstonia solanacearum]CUV64277.1 conserved protein of unknown function [Ralstonia solanacearum]
MLRVIKPFAGKTVTDAEAGDLNCFLRDVLVEVASENYRQTMYEVMALEGQQTGLNPPLRANERVMSGLFATAISRAALRSRTEVRIDRPESAESIGEQDGAEANGRTTNHGRVDYMAWYGTRVIGVELKMAGMNCEEPKLTDHIVRRWTKAVEQAKTVQDCLRVRQKEDRVRYPNPVSLALMVIVGRRSIVENAQFSDGDLKDMQDATTQMLAKLTPRPTFQAIYTFPSEFRTLVPRHKGVEVQKSGRAVYTPFVSFIAKPAVNSMAG